MPPPCHFFLLYLLVNLKPLPSRCAEVALSTLFNCATVAHLPVLCAGKVTSIWLNLRHAEVAQERGGRPPSPRLRGRGPGADPAGRPERRCRCWRAPPAGRLFIS